MELDLKNAYSEVLKVLEYVPREDFDKIPKEIIQVFEENRNKDYNIDFEVDDDELKISKDAKVILAILFRDYWATEVQRSKIIEKERYDLKKIENEKQNKYEWSNILSKRKLKYSKETKSEQINEKTEELAQEQNKLIQYKESFITTIIGKIKRIFKLER